MVKVSSTLLLSDCGRLLVYMYVLECHVVTMHMTSVHVQ